MMKRLTFTRLPAHGAGGIPTEGTVVDLLLAIPYLLQSRIVPPRHILNEVLGTGEVALGMSGGCRWEPFTLTPEEYDELVIALAEGDDARRATFVAPPAWVRTFDEWHAWTQEYRHGIPADRNLEYTRRLSALDAEREVAESRGDGEALTRTLSELTELAAEYSDWIARHRRSQ